MIMLPVGVVVGLVGALLVAVVGRRAA